MVPGWWWIWPLLDWLLKAWCLYSLLFAAWGRQCRSSWAELPGRGAGSCSRSGRWAQEPADGAGAATAGVQARGATAQEVTEYYLNSIQTNMKNRKTDHGHCNTTNCCFHQTVQISSVCFQFNVFKSVDLINGVWVSADFSLVAHRRRPVRPVFQSEMERALLQGERQAELDQMEAETDIIAQLQHKLDELESAIQREKDKVRRTADKPSN